MKFVCYGRENISFNFSYSHLKFASLVKSARIVVLNLPNISALYVNTLLAKTTILIIARNVEFAGTQMYPNKNTFSNYN